ncbi:MAG TPA: hypothetical protein EYG92_04080 [Lutibacter sp.]|nr:hypothetical protein [Lutibacter sp.]
MKYFLRKILLLPIFFILLNAENFDIRTGTTIHNDSAFRSYLAKENTPLSEHGMCQHLTGKECLFPTKAFMLSKILKKYLISSGTNSVRSLKFTSKKYWEYALLSDAIYNKENDILVKTHVEVDKSGWQLYKYKQALNGLVVGLYKKDNNYIMAIGGTTANSKLIPIYNNVLDLWTDLTLISETIFKPNQLLTLKNWYKSLSSDVKTNIIAITGHSLGGGLAQYMGLLTGIKTYTFNTAPLPLTYDSSKDLNGGYSIKEIENPYYTHWADNIKNSHRIPPEHTYGEEARIKPLKKITIDVFENFTNDYVITNIMTKNDPLTGILKYTDYVEQSDNIANIIIKQSVLNGLKNTLSIQKKHSLSNLIVGKKVELPLETGHSISKISVIMKVANELLEKGIYVIADTKNGKYYIYHLPEGTSDIFNYKTINEPLAFKNISTKKDWVYKYILKMQEYGMSLSGDGKGNFNKSASRTQGEVLKIITKLFYRKNDLKGVGFVKYYNFLKTKKRALTKLLPSNFTKDALDKNITRGDMAEILTNILFVEDKITKADSKRARNLIDESNGWYLASSLLNILDIAHGQNGNYGWNNDVTQAESLKFFIRTYEYYSKE